MQRKWAIGDRVLKHQCCKGGSKSGKGGGGGGSATAEKTIAGTGTHADSEITAKEYAQALGISEVEAQARFDAIERFTGSDYTRFREDEVAGRSNVEVDRINAYLKTMPAFSGEIHRGISFDSETEYNNFARQVLTEKGLSMQAMSSFTSDRSIAEQFRADGKYGVMMTVVNNQSGRSVRGKSNFQGEDEVLVGRGTRYRIVGGQQTTTPRGDKTLNLILEEY